MNNASDSSGGLVPPPRRAETASGVDEDLMNLLGLSGAVAREGMDPDVGQDME